MPLHVDDNPVLEVYAKLWDLMLDQPAISQPTGVRLSNQVKVTDGRLIPNIGRRTDADLHRMTLLVKDSEDEGAVVTTENPMTFCEEDGEDDSPDVLEQEYELEFVHPRPDATRNLVLELAVRRAIRCRKLFKAGLKYVTNVEISTTRDIVTDEGPDKGRERTVMTIRVFMRFED